MRQEIEIEFKNLLTESEYEKLLEAYSFSPEIKQVNYYFETEDLSLRKARSALRIREKNSSYTVTLKQPKNGHLLEGHITLEEEEAKECIKGNFIQNQDFTNQLASLGVNPQDLLYMGSLTTYRRSYIDGDHIYVLDYSLYNDKEDFEFELEVQNAKLGKELFLHILEQADIALRK